MMVRLPFDIPVWELALSFALLFVHSYTYHLVLGQNLPCRYFNVWKETEHQRNDQMGKI